MTVDMTEVRFFVVRTFNGTDHFSIENGDFPSSGNIVYRVELAPANNSLSLDAMMEAYKRGVRLKPIPKPPSPPKVPDRNSVKERYLAKLRADRVSTAS